MKGTLGVGVSSVARKSGPFVRRKGDSSIEDENPAITEIEFGGAPGWFPGGLLRGDTVKLNDKLNIAFIGMGGQIQGHVEGAIREGHRIALRLQKDIEWDGPNMKAKGLPEADILIAKENRAKWL